MIKTSGIPVPGANPCDMHDIVRRQLRYAVCAALLLLLCGAPPAVAIGPEAPVDFLDVYATKGFMLLVIEPEQIANLEVMRIVHQDGEPAQREEVEWKRLRMLDYTSPITGPNDFQYRDPSEHRKPRAHRPQSVPRQLPSIDSARSLPDLRLANGDTPVVASDASPHRIGVLIPLESKAQHELKDGVYAEKFIARARLAGESATGKPLTMVRWSHFVMRDQQSRFISQAEYSRMLDPTTDGVDGSGGKIELHLGHGVKADVPIEKTRRNRAVPLGQLGRHGGLEPERDDSRKDPPSNEVNEQ